MASITDQLPESLLLVIFSYLCFRDIFRMRAVCRLWRNLLGSHNFAKTWKAEKSLVFSQATYRNTPLAYLDFMARRSCDGSDDDKDTQWSDVMLQVWSPASGVRTKFSTVGLPPLHPPFCPCFTGLLQKRPVGDRFRGDPCFAALASCEGLVCGLLKEEPGYVLAVGNPLTWAWKKLPTVPHPPLLPENSQLCALMLVDTSTYSYTVALFPRETRSPNEAWRYHPLTYEADDEPFWLLIFDSRDDRWEFAPPFKWSSLSCHTNCSAPPYSSIPFFFPLPPSRSSSKYFRIAAFDIDTRSWSAVAEALLPKELNSWFHLGYRVFPYQGKCFLIAAEFQYNLCCAAWVLEDQSKSFKLLSSMSTCLKDAWDAYIAFSDDASDDPYKFVTDGNLVIVSPASALELWPIMAYNLELCTWTMVEEPHPQFAYDRLCVLSPSILTAP